jgi:hypothetical protein
MTYADSPVDLQDGNLRNAKSPGVVVFCTRSDDDEGTQQQYTSSRNLAWASSFKAGVPKSEVCFTSAQVLPKEKDLLSPSGEREQCELDP